ncbi:MAG TPA: bifunctional hydroxymethylpyrimidine kinase/phosphomethylpyrimidine kinase [Methanoregulaceae archaeon]|jgi:hydroxymethylpyrimidine/phosphomethylpyrimidine kinase|nr:bifunctional hydroxymethylpyrimidine kinase/phosphomethylpyrimidine kinase [Burkholderiaceae bacterium]HNJ81692.1 bifunctional hydroxymethylpyrimidine kinase/phosphomethylpyrimidine kinase [Methanoregulaceae archaeon]HOH81152.1 bifunctional hydroxymethylpyrimidine kinase/phosphomethylpyrimidine kinase [Methanoregulaceae archaeon]HOU80531.1 bifunctional hydroxymethylpyrimidine kinase/phosphomethylpyrimidine kinase [Methanoregulaceae archaeon]
MSTAALPAACTIAGSDSGGGAGIQADLKTFAALGIWGTSVVTAITAQNTREVFGVSMVPEAMVTLQIRAVLEDFPVRAVKTGMLGSAGMIRAVARALPPDIPLVLDPVMVATSGSRLLDEDATGILLCTLLPRATVVTPNIPEALVLSGMKQISTIPEMKEAGRTILDLGPDYVVVTGGHLPGNEAVDILVGPDTEMMLKSPKYPYGVHGSGCCFSAAMAGYLAHDCSVELAFSKAKGFVDGAIQGAVMSRSGHYSVRPG